MTDRLAEIKARWTDGTLGYADYAALGAAAVGKADVDWLVARIEDLESELQGRDHMLDAMGQKYGFHLE